MSSLIHGCCSSTSGCLRFSSPPPSSLPLSFAGPLLSFCVCVLGRSAQSCYSSPAFWTLSSWRQRWPGRRSRPAMEQSHGLQPQTKRAGNSEFLALPLLHSTYYSSHTGTVRTEWPGLKKRPRPGLPREQKQRPRWWRPARGESERNRRLSASFITIILSN